MLKAIRIVGMATSVPGQRRSFLRSMQKGPGQDRNKSLHLFGKPKNTTCGIPVAYMPPGNNRQRWRHWRITARWRVFSKAMNKLRQTVHYPSTYKHQGILSCLSFTNQHTDHLQTSRPL